MTDRPTDRPRYSAGNNRPRARRVSATRPKNAQLYIRACIGHIRTTALLTFSVTFQPKGRRVSQADLKPMKSVQNQHLSNFADLLKQPVSCLLEDTEPLPPISSKH